MREQVQSIGGCALAAALGLVARVRQPTLRGELRLPGLESSVEVRRDRWGVPHLLASNLHDLFFSQGFVHAQDRLWQMDFNRRFAAGRLSELLGDTALPVDRGMRVLGFWRAAAADVPDLRENLRSDFEGYAAGVNAAIESQPRPLECRLLRYRPEPWTPSDTLAWVRVIAWFMSCNWRDEVVRARLISRLGEEEERKLEPERREHYPGTADLCGLLAEEPAEAPALPLEHHLDAGMGLGSNSWVIHGSRTASGAPLLANDSHLSLLIPAMWYENHLQGGDLHLTGVSFPGLPGIVLGHNGHVAWGFTNGYADVEDLYLEHLRRENNETVLYEFRGEWRPASVRQELIQIRGGKAANQEVVATEHGPIVNSLIPHLAGDQPLALKWTSLGRDTTAAALEGVWRAQTCEELRAAFKAWTGPNLNAVYADVQGDIGYSLIGDVPMRARGCGQVPVPGWTGEYEWMGVVPYEELPHLHNPTEGYVATANNRQTWAACSHFLSDDYCSGARGERITELIEAAGKVDTETIERQQQDQVSVLARLVGRELHRLANSDRATPPAWAQMFEDWDGNLAASSPQAAFYETFVDELSRTELGPRLGELYSAYLAEDSSSPVLPWCLFREHAREWLGSVLEKPESGWWTSRRERDEALRRIGDRAATRLSERSGEDPRRWSWGSLHQLHLRHALGAVAALSRFLNRGPFPVGGDSTTVWMETAIGEAPMVGPPFRFVADLGNLAQSRSVLLPGQSGRPGTAHYDDQIDDWFEGRYHPMLFNRADVEREATDVLKLLPR